MDHGAKRMGCGVTLCLFLLLLLLSFYGDQDGEVGGYDGELVSRHENIDAMNQWVAVVSAFFSNFMNYYYHFTIVVITHKNHKIEKGLSGPQWVAVGLCLGPIA